MKPKDCSKHCWHVTSSTTNGLAVEGHDNEICCTCGVKRERPWRMVNDPRHGPFNPVQILRYRDKDATR